MFYRINKDEGDESLALPALSKRCCQCNFSEIFGIVSSSQVGITIYPIDHCYDDTKHY